MKPIILLGPNLFQIFSLLNISAKNPRPWALGRRPRAQGRGEESLRGDSSSAPEALTLSATTYIIRS